MILIFKNMSQINEILISKDIP